MGRLPAFLKSPVLYIVLFIFVFIGGIYWAFLYKEKKALAKPDDVKVIHTWELTERLMELSGISYMGNGKMACVQDEEGVIFVYDLLAKEVFREIDFGDPGDYEAIAVVDSIAYILRSDGTIFEAEIPPDPRAAEASAKVQNQTETSVKEYEIPEFEDFDMESICYDKKNNRLLLTPKKDKAETKQKKVFAFDLETKKLNPDPLFEVDLEDKIREVDYGNEIFADNEEFEEILPADMAVHPISNKIYIIDASSHLILEFSPEGKYLGVYRLNSYLFKNPEGITFAPDGTMYISSEGSIGALANIWKIELEKTKRD